MLLRRFGRDSRNCRTQSVLFHGLEEIIEGIDLERFDGIAIIRRDKHELGQCLAADQVFDDLKAIEAGHLDVEKKQIRRELTDHVYRFDSVARLTDDIYLGNRLEEKTKFLARKLFIVDDQSA